MTKVNKAKILESVSHDEYLVADPKEGLIVVYDGEKAEEHGMRVINRLYVNTEDPDTMEEIEVEKVIDSLSEALRHTIDAKQLLARVLREMPPPELLKVKAISERTPEALQKAKTREGCFFIDLEDPLPGHESVPIYIRS